MRDHVLAACIAAPALFLSAAALAQSEEPKIAPDSDPASAEPATPLEKEMLRAEHLDGLFERLANPSADDWEVVQTQIWTAWSQSGSDSMDLLLFRATRAMDEGDHDTALIHLNDLVRLAPDFAEGWNKRATLHFMVENYGDSISDIARTLALEPRHFGALSGLGIILDRLGDKEGALEAYRRASAIHPHLPGASEGIKKLSKEVEGQRL